MSVPATAKSDDPACDRIHDVIRISIDQIIGGAQTNRVLVALSAAERLDCDINGLLATLGLGPIRPAEGLQSEPAVRLRDSDRR